MRESRPATPCWEGGGGEEPEAVTPSEQSDLSGKSIRHSGPSQLTPPSSLPQQLDFLTKPPSPSIRGSPALEVLSRLS